MPPKHKLRDRRLALEYTQVRLGEAADVSQSTISRIECHRGPNVPLNERDGSHTKLWTAIKLSAIVEGIPAGDYTPRQLAKLTRLWTEAEIYEGLRVARIKPKRSSRSSRHLKAVA